MGNAVHNPWIHYAEEKLKLLEQSPDEITNTREYDFVLKQDRASAIFKDFYERPLCLQAYLPPVPYVGDPRSAKVILLCKNPGFVGGGNDPEYQNQRTFVKESLLSLKFESSYPIHYLDENFRKFRANDWWHKATDTVVEKALGMMTSNDEAAKLSILRKIAAVQWLPYHSRSLSIKPAIRKNPLFHLPSLSFTRYLVEDALNRDAILVLIYGSGNKELWTDLLPTRGAEFLEKAICKRPEYKGDINVKELTPKYYLKEDIQHIVNALARVEPSPAG